MPELDRPGPLSKAQHLAEKRRQRVQLTLAELRDRPEIRRVETDDGHKVDPFPTDLGDPPRRIDPVANSRRAKAPSSSPDRMALPAIDAVDPLDLLQAISPTTRFNTNRANDPHPRTPEPSPASVHRPSSGGGACPWAGKTPGQSAIPQATPRKKCLTAIGSCTNIPLRVLNAISLRQLLPKVENMAKFAHLYGLTAKEALDLTPTQAQYLEDHAKQVAKNYLSTTEAQKKLSDVKSHVLSHKSP